MIVTHALLSEGEESIANLAKTSLMLNAMESITRSMKTCKKLLGSIPFLQKLYNRGHTRNEIIQKVSG